MGKKENTNIKILLSVSSTDEGSAEVVNKTAVIELAFPMCKNMLEMKNELEILKERKLYMFLCAKWVLKISKTDYTK